MKKIINILLAVCLMVSMLGVSALAETYPLTHTYPTLIDFNDETTGRYDEVDEIPNNFYHFRKYVEVFAYEEDATDKYLFINSTGAVNLLISLMMRQLPKQEKLSPQNLLYQWI